MIQNERMERLFKKFDSDGSGCLDTNELHGLFQENHVDIEKEKLRVMFDNQKFTLRSFKNINNSPDSLKSMFLIGLNNHLYRVQRLNA